MIEQIRASGVTVVLVTHFLEEAERLCDRIAVIDSGSIVALDTPAALASATDGEQRIRFQPSIPIREEQLASLPGMRNVEVHGHQVVVTGIGRCARDRRRRARPRERRRGTAASRSGEP